MKLLVLFFVAAAWLHIPADGYATKIRSLDFSQFADRRAIESFRDERDWNSQDNAASDTLKSTLRRLFTIASWRGIIIGQASPEVMRDPKFRAKWSITKADERTKERNAFEDNNKSARIKAKNVEFFTSTRWKALIVLSSSKAELLDPVYRQQWGLGNLRVNINDLDENGNFFQGPQWRVFQDMTGLRINDSLDDWAKGKIVMDWVATSGRMMAATEEDD